MYPGKQGYFTRQMRVHFVIIVIAALFLWNPPNLFAATCTVTATDAESIQTLIDAATAGDVVCIPAGTYQVSIVLKSNITIQGLELARTVLESANALSPIITGAASATVQNVIVQDDGVAISADNIDGFIIRNVIISDATTGIDCDDANLTVSHVVFNSNTTAISCRENSNLTLKNTIFFNNTTDLNLVDTTQTFNNNLLYINDNANYPPTETTSVFDEDPLFVDVANNDFHLKATSPAIDAGDGDDLDLSTADIGAYGGSEAGLTPFPVSGLNITAQGVDTVTLEWAANEAHNISSYNVYFDTDTTGELYEGTAAEGTSPIGPIALDQLSQVLTTLVFSPVTLAAPTGLTTVPGDKTILVSWESVTDATGYQVLYGTTSGVYTVTVDVGSSVIHQITGLTNDVGLFITVKAYFHPTVYLVVSAVDDNTNESALVNELSTVLTENISTGSAATEVSDFPEESVIFPDLADEYDCFIATAAYGSALEPQVVLLRKFRNHFLLTNSPGKRFVALYYQLSPAAASFINEHAWLKPFARTALYPVVGFSWFCLKTGKTLILVSFMIFFASFLAVRMVSRRKQCG
ncbi:CFI-box-CTERM domain-containing protein [Thermodesulfobacteriota bacterium]